MQAKHKFVSSVLFLSFAMLMACESDDPVREDAPEMITKVTLVFTPASGPAVVVTATDPDGEGVQDIQTDGPINLDPSTSYTLTIELINDLAKPGEEGYDIGLEVAEEADEHMFFFGWEGPLFSSPEGDGNIDARSGAVNYIDEDVNGLPLGLETDWTTAASAASGKFRVVLKHQPDLKSETSGSNVGESDLDIEFDVNVD